MQYPYAIDPSEYAAYDELGIVLGGQVLMVRRAANGASGWTMASFGIPAQMRGTSQMLTIYFWTKDGALNDGQGVAIDDIGFSQLKRRLR